MCKGVEEKKISRNGDLLFAVCSWRVIGIQLRIICLHDYAVKSAASDWSLFWRLIYVNGLTDFYEQFEILVKAFVFHLTSNLAVFSFLAIKLFIFKTICRTNVNKTPWKHLLKVTYAWFANPSNTASGDFHRKFIASAITQSNHVITQMSVFNQLQLENCQQKTLPRNFNNHFKEILQNRHENHHKQPKSSNWPNVENVLQLHVLPIAGVIAGQVWIMQPNVTHKSTWTII